MDGASLTPEQEKLNALKQVLPEVFAEGKVDWEKLKATLGEDINFSNERYVLNWAGKSEAFKVLQTPTTKTLIPAKDESVNFDETEHIFIEGENLEVLKVLQKSYFGKVKMIYIDPPYNTGNDSFIYPDKFSESKADYEKRVGDKDEEGYMTKDGMFKKNSKENGQYHSNWLNMMMPRLYLAKNLLKQDGVIFVSIDDNEVHNLRLLMNEIFGEENFVGNVVWERSFSPVNLKKHFSESHDYLLVYSKNLEVTVCNGLIRKDNKRYKNPDNDSRGDWTSSDMTVGPAIEDKIYEITTPSGRKLLPTNGRCWLYTKERYEEMVADNRIWFGKNGNNTPRVKKFFSEVKEGITPMTVWKHEDVGHSQDAAQKLKKLFNNKQYFDYPKPVGLIQRTLELYSNENDLILDFFSGSGTTAHAVMALNAEDGGNRKCISVQLPEKCDEKSEAFKAGYKTIADIAKERIRRAAIEIAKEKVVPVKSKNTQQTLGLDIGTDSISSIKFTTETETTTFKNTSVKNQDLGFKVLKLSDSNFKQWQQITGKDKQALEEQMKLFVDPVAKNATTENMVYELLLKSGKDLNSTIEAKDGFYAINETELVLILEKANQEIIDSVIASKPQKVIALDKLFKGNDQLKTNASLQMKDAGIEFKTI
ncbi:site-specific DNA-methyltransferase [Xanthomarina gelatinilytica]|uniref:site-specific DNA-methyltransferase n=1 Tax=Xanthomarina gelatinilytica TaxID=1137281 RepID=UPI003AA888FD